MTVLLKSDLLVYVYGPQNRKPSSGFTVSSYTLLLKGTGAGRQRQVSSQQSSGVCVCSSGVQSEAADPIILDFWAIILMYWANTNNTAIYFSVIIL